MKTLVTLIMLLVIPAISPIRAAGQEKSTAVLKVIYFHGNTRCTTCTNMEKYTRELLNEEFSKEMEDGKMVFEVYNYEEEANAAVVKKFSIESSTLLLVQVKPGKEKVTDLTDIGFTYAKYQPEKFKEEVRKKINDRLRL